MYRLASPEVCLRPLDLENAETLAYWGTDDEFCRAAGWTVGLSHEDHVTFQRRLIEHPPSDLTRLGVHAQAGLVGYVALQGNEPSRRELGFVIGGRSRWGHGYGTAAAHAGLVHGFTTMRLTEIWAEALEANLASVAILRRLGMHETGLGGEGQYAGTPSRYRQFSLGADEFAPRHLAGGVRKGPATEPGARRSLLAGLPQ
ncbi:GNAT family N-acetyltransferase [Intrasporangium oryzae]|uniref:GNAT family N-acetyltransferase n=1 Tax=Intrasporangium oryzae TaxID=412687 RepID=UPI0012FBBB34|nr:GNAT family N-acetyltransferase [Intrasporangium oryzae]